MARIGYTLVGDAVTLGGKYVLPKVMRYLPWEIDLLSEFVVVVVATVCYSRADKLASR